MKAPLLSTVTTGARLESDLLVSPGKTSRGRAPTPSDALGQPTTKSPSPERAAEFFNTKTRRREAVKFGRVNLLASIAVSGPSAGARGARPSGRFNGRRIEAIENPDAQVGLDDEAE